MIKRLLFLGVIGAVGALLLRVFVIEGVYAASDSMAPTLPTGQAILVNKLSYFFSDPNRGDIILFKNSHTEMGESLKRIIGKGGEQIEIRRKTVFINGEALIEPYVQFLRPDEILVGDNISPTVIPEDHYFVMGDNRDVSNDSRDWLMSENENNPFVPKNDIKGKVIGS